MAQRRRAQTRSGIGNDIVVVNAGPPARRNSGGGIRRRRSSGGGRRRRRSSSKSSGSTSVQHRIQRMAVGGFCYGQLVKNFPTLPTIPALGRAGTVAAAVYFLKPSSQIIQDIGIAAAVLAGVSFGQTGVVAGDEDDEVISG